MDAFLPKRTLERATDAAGARVAWLVPRHAALGLCAALLVQQLPALPPAGSGVALAAVALLLGLAARGGCARACVVVLLAAGWTLAHAERALAVRIPPALEQRDLRVDGIVDGLPDRGRDRVAFELVTVRVLGPGGGPLPGRLRLSLYQPQSHPLAEALVSGARVRAEVRLRRPRGLVNPGGFDAERHALERRLAASGYVRRLDAVDHDPIGAVERARQAIVDWIAAAQGAGRTAAVLRALAVGDQAPLEEDDWALFRATGTSHLIAISGFHIGLVGGFCALLAGLLWRRVPALALVCPRPQAGAACALAGAAAYSLLAGLSPPVQRTLVMIAVVALARMLRRPLGPAQGLGLAALVALALDPLAVLNAGFWLSFAGVAWLIWCLGGRAQASLPVSFGRAQLAATVGLAPIGLALFQQVSLVGPLANLVAIPAVSAFIVPVLLVAIALRPAVPGLADALLAVAAGACAALLEVLEVAARQPWAEVLTAPPPAWAVLLALAGAALLLAPLGAAARALGLTLLLPLYLPQPRAPAPGTVELWVLDVGQGQAVLVRDAAHATLIDTGPAWGDYSAARAVVLPALRALGVRRIDELVLSHGDNDHAGGAPVLAAAFPGVRVRAGADLAGHRQCTAGERWEGAAYRVTVLHPPAHFPALGNDSACVLRVDAAGGSVLLPSDIGALIERRLVRERAALAADVVLLPHHGSRSSSDPAFVAAVGAGVAVASAGWRNRHGHPAAEVVARWKAGGAAVLGTAGSGAIAIRIGPQGPPQVRRWRDLDRRYWREPESLP